MLEDLHWFGFKWNEGPDVGGKFGPYNQSERMEYYLRALEKLREGDFIYACTCSRRDIQAAASAPHAEDDEPIYPGTCRSKRPSEMTSQRFNWRFRVNAGEAISFGDENLGGQKFIAGKDFGDFVVWRHDDAPAYQLACVVDDAAMQITEVVRGADLLMTTARQMLLYRALDLRPPRFFHCELLRDAEGRRLAKRHDGLSLSTLRGRGKSPEELRQNW